MLHAAAKASPRHRRQRARETVGKDGRFGQETTEEGEQTTGRQSSFRRESNVSHALDPQFLSHTGKTCGSMLSCALLGT